MITTILSDNLAVAPDFVSTSVLSLSWAERQYKACPGKVKFWKVRFFFWFFFFLSLAWGGRTLSFGSLHCKQSQHRFRKQVFEKSGPGTLDWRRVMALGLTCNVFSSAWELRLLFIGSDGKQLNSMNIISRASTDINVTVIQCNNI